MNPKLGPALGRWDGRAGPTPPAHEPRSQAKPGAPPYLPTNPKPSNPLRHTPLILEPQNPLPEQQELPLEFPPSADALRNQPGTLPQRLRKRLRAALPGMGFLAVASLIALALPGTPLRELSSRGFAPRPPASELLRITPVSREGILEVVILNAPQGLRLDVELLTSGDLEFDPTVGVAIRSEGTTVYADFRRLSRSGSTLDKPFRIGIPSAHGEILIRTELRNLLQWSVGSFRFGEGILVDPRPEGVEVLVPVSY